MGSVTMANNFRSIGDLNMAAEAALDAIESPAGERCRPVDRPASIDEIIAGTNPRHRVDRSGVNVWYMLGVIPQSQLRVCQRAKELGFETYCPMSRMPPQVRKFGRKRVAAEVIRPLMPGYVFVAMPTSAPRFDLFQRHEPGGSHPAPLPPDIDAGYVADKARPTLEPIRGCLGLLSGSEGPRAVSEVIIQSMRDREAAGEFDLVSGPNALIGRSEATGRHKAGRFMIPKWVKRGVLIKFVDGPFKEFEGTVIKVVGKSLVRVSTSLFGRISEVDAPIDWIKGQKMGVY